MCHVTRQSRHRVILQAFEISARLQAALVKADQKESMDKQGFTTPDTLSLPPKKRLPLNVRAGINSDLENLRSRRTDYSEIYTNPKHFSLLKWLESNEKQYGKLSKGRKSLRKRKNSVSDLEDSSMLDESLSASLKDETKTGVNGFIDKNSDDESDFIGFPEDGVNVSIVQPVHGNSSKLQDLDCDSNSSGFAGFSDDGTDPDGFPGFPDDGWNFCSLKVIKKTE